MTTLYSQIPSTDRLLRDEAFASLLTTYGHRRVTQTLRQLQDEARAAIRDAQRLPAWCENWAQAALQRLEQESSHALRSVFNLSGTVLHTNLGRAVQSQAAIDAVTTAMGSAVTLEYDLDGAGRGHRDRAIAALLCQLTLSLIHI